MNEKVEYMKTAKKMVETIENIQLKKVDKLKHIKTFGYEKVQEDLERQGDNYITLHNFLNQSNIADLTFNDIRLYGQDFLAGNEVYYIRIFIDKRIQQIIFIVWECFQNNIYR